MRNEAAKVCLKLDQSETSSVAFRNANQGEMDKYRVGLCRGIKSQQACLMDELSYDYFTFLMHSSFFLLLMLPTSKSSRVIFHPYSNGTEDLWTKFLFWLKYFDVIIFGEVFA